jgi:predicted murein hydrolase (TIGR00659 family)
MGLGAASWLLLTMFLYYSVKRLHRRWPVLLLTPIVFVPLALVAVLLIGDVSYTAYDEGAQWLSELLGPATVALALPLHRYFHLLKKHAWEILAGVVAGSLFAVLTNLWLAEWVRLGPDVVRSLAPRSVTSPIAMEIAKMIGGMPTLTASVVILTGVIGMLVGPTLIQLLGLESEAARGVMFGVGAHGVGTAKAFQIGEVEGMFSSLSMILAAGVSIAIIPWVLSIW